MPVAEIQRKLSQRISADIRKNPRTEFRHRFCGMVTDKTKDEAVRLGSAGLDRLPQCLVRIVHLNGSALSRKDAEAFVKEEPDTSDSSHLVKELDAFSFE